MGRVAIVDDDDDAREMFKVLLSDGQDLLTFGSGQEFLKEFHPGSFDVILLDLAMPVMDGLEVFQRIQAVDKDVPVVAITAMAFPAEKERSLRAGFCDYFVKPIMDIERFRQTVYSHIGECSSPQYDSSENEPAA